MFNQSDLIIGIFSFLILTLIIYWMTRDYYLSIGISFILVLILYVSTVKTPFYEGFDVEELAKELEDVAQTGKDPSQIIDKMKEIDENKEDKITDDDLGLFDEENEEKIIQKENKTEDYKKYMSTMTPVKAQRETFRLINTMKQLEDTLKGMEPVLKRGANVIEKMKALNLG